MLMLSSLLQIGAVSGDEPREASVTNQIAERLELPGIHNAFRATPRIYSGSQPEGDAAFAALAKRGIKTILSVDGSIPDVAAARKHGLRYVHLPFGYDGIPAARVAALAKLATELDGPFFVHCHHGLHRGPAAVAVMCEATAGWTTNHAVAWMQLAGTAPDYPGLYRAAAAFTPPSAAALATVVEFPEITRPASLVQTMVALDSHITALKASQKVGWKAPAGQPEFALSTEATLLLDQLRELARTPDAAERPEAYRTRLEVAEQAASEFRAQGQLGDSPEKLDAAFKKLSASCTSCHQKFRNE